MNKAFDLLDIIVRKIFGLVFKIMHKEYTDGVHEAMLQFVKFGIVGVTNTFLALAINWISLIVLEKMGILVDNPSGQASIANVIAFLLSVLWSFYWNNKLVFVLEDGQQRNILRTLLKTYVSYSFTGIFLNTLLLYLWIDVIGLSKFVAPLINLLVSVPINFLINKFWAFKSK